MSSTTEKLSLFKYDTTADVKQPFNIDTCMNNNWEKIDQFAKDIDTVFSSGLSSQLDKKVFSDINTQLGKKLEADVLLAENGYIKFNNGIIICWGLESTASRRTIILPFTYKDSYRYFISINTWTANSPYSCAIRAINNSSIEVDRWYENGTALSAVVSYLTIGF